MSKVKGVLPNGRQHFSRDYSLFVIPTEVEESLTLRIPRNKRFLDCARHDKNDIWATRFEDLTAFLLAWLQEQQRQTTNERE